MPDGHLRVAAGDLGTAAAGAELLALPAIRSQRGHAAFNALLRASFARRYRISTYRIFNRWMRRDDGPWQEIRYAAIEVLSLLGSRQPLFGWQVRNHERLYRRSRDLGPVIRQLEGIQPSLVVSTNCQFSDEFPYLLAARDLGVPTLGCIQSFDNLTSRSVLPVFDYYALWNQRMKDQLLQYYLDRDPGKVQITGTPQFDFHVRLECRASRRATPGELVLRQG